MDTINILNGADNFICEYIGNAVGFEYPLTRPVIEDIAGRDGALYISNRFGRRPLAWTGLIRSDVMASRRELIKVCKVGNLKTIQFTTCDGLALQTNIDILNLIAPYKNGQTVYHIEAVAPDYRFYSQDLIIAYTYITESQGGTPIPAAIPAPIGGGSSVDFSITNLGNIDTDPTFVIRGPGTNFVVRNLTTGRSFNLNLTLLNNETVRIDTLNKTAYKGVQNVFGSVVGDWFTLVPGVNRITFSASSGTDVNTRLAVEYRHAYLGI